MWAVVFASMLVLATGASLIWPALVELPLAMAIGLIFAASVGYNLAAILALIGFTRDRAERSAMAGEISAPPITILKPVCGDEHALYANLRSYCVQDYPEYQVIFGVRDVDDPAVAVVQRLLDEFPERDLELVIDSRVYGTNYKVSNLLNMYTHAKHDIVLSSDSDVRVGPEFLSVLGSEFDDPGIGAVTCLYTGSPGPGFASRFGAAYLTHGFTPSAIVQARFGGLKGCFGQAMAFRRDVLEAIGGFGAITSRLADDYALGNRVKSAGYRIRLSSYCVENVVTERNLRSLFRHEQRWGRTIHGIAPVGYFFSFVTHSIPISLIAVCLLLGFGTDVHVAAILAAGAVGARFLLYRVVNRVLAVPSATSFLLISLRECFSLMVWASSLAGRRVRWRGAEFVLMNDGNLRAVTQADA